MSIDVLPFELLCKVIESCHIGTVSRCVLVCSSFKEAALPSLYKTITLKTFRNSESGEGLKSLRNSESGEGLNFGALQTLDKYPYLRSYVRDVRFFFLLSDYVRRTRNTKVNSDPKAREHLWVSSLAKLPNITSYTFCSSPPQYQSRFLPIPHELIELMASALVACDSLREVNLLYRATAADIARLSRLRNVRSVHLGLPSNEVIAAVGNWIEKCESFSIRDAYAVDSLATIQPYVSNLSVLHLGPHHALTHRNILQLLECTNKLQQLDIFYDNFLNVQLVWIDAVISSSPLTSLSLLSDDGKECAFPFPLISLLAKKTQLEFLNIPQVVFARHPCEFCLSCWWISCKVCLSYGYYS
ncbi:hypothetical protein BT96DRAFT_915827 [Gymnopus androsaceus JB14]|uniref:F-box domain-containing protein n=1 Tax=Gymnopus androsaceus JB14 TaxID=1447944 RepID=A0A6A4I5N0_9AGAR|nr:hypothetical protein BT96DRAFT_915827 [Gymnopus androsaceus JB14]